MMCPVLCKARRAAICRRTAVGRLAVLMIVAVPALYSAELRPQSKEQPHTSCVGIRRISCGHVGFLFVAGNSETSGQRGVGYVHVFQRRDSAWVHAGILSAPDATVKEDFGVSMAADGAILAVGAQYTDVHGRLRSGVHLRTAPPNVAAGGGLVGGRCGARRRVWPHGVRQRRDNRRRRASRG